MSGRCIRRGAGLPWVNVYCSSISRAYICYIQFRRTTVTLLAAHCPLDYNI